MDAVSAKVLGSIALVFGVVFVSTSFVRLTRPDVILLLVLLNMALGIRTCSSPVSPTSRPGTPSPVARPVRDRLTRHPNVIYRRMRGG
jgi:hypothetical protein